MVLDQYSRHEQVSRARLTAVPRTDADRSLEPGLREALPGQLTSFVGREQHVAEVRRLLVEPRRLLTLTGFGGVGKTRLALEVAASLLDTYPHGVHLVELAALADPLLVPRAVASALGLDDEPGRAPLDLVQAALRHQRLLLLLDNCEHLLEACADLADRLLRACPGVQILATSLEALGIDGETVWQVPSLDVPSDRLPLADSARSGAVRLFVERAQARQPDFVLTDATLPAVTTICRSLDGIPLAIELAVAWIPTLTVDELAGRLGDRFRLLTGGSRTALPRHRTLKALVDWSYDRLSDDERALMARLSVFAGGWTLEAAEGAGCWVSGFGGRGDGLRSPETRNPTSKTLETLAGLLAKSLVLVTSRGGTTRYGYLETIRQYAAEKLVPHEEQAARHRHAIYFAELAERAELELRGPEQRAWLDRLDADHDNMRAALRWSIDQNEADLALRLCSGLRVYWWIRANLNESAGWLEQALAVRGPATPRARARALNGAGDVARSRGEYDRSTAFHTEALELARQIDDRREIALAIHYLASLAEVRGDFGEAGRLYEHDLALFRALGDDVGAARALNNLGIVVRGQGDYARAAELCEESLGIRRALGDVWGIAASLDELARVARARRDVTHAAELCLESLCLFHSLGVKRHVAGALDIAAWVAAARGQHERAARLYGSAAALREAIGSAALPNEQGPVSRDLAALRLALGPARFADAWADGRALSPEEAVDAATGILTPRVRAVPDLPGPALSRREQEVVERIARGLSNREIAAELVISGLTVESHVRNILRKLGLERRGQVAAWATQHGLN